ncbi:methylmalonyl-CoA mutase family protein [Candidatus Contendibacter odensensis]|uniref:methylmalonyl-CoA mutase n=1 Tax=Candidatus Contendobacter odensis Run_B_J11 TaxID=1400861 RepID=A0A7U7GDW3_9GAMM|nr:methylmalonyl-CoA mutase family protein [Candidatus Contendobacter odensis]MBK8752049.1 acyl-CoA mutase large subunit family protein [Candidatus Competibacteraceae bacterium]CDH46608.1 Methylmalonyl-CoA mutase, large subunit [Candidatus Contendobacter odensis Run_B_J11]
MSDQQLADAATPTFSEFPPTPYEEWRKVVDKFLKGAPFEKRLITKTYEEIDLQPMYRREDVAGLPHLDSLPGFAPYLRGTSPLGYVTQSWDVAQELPCATPAEFNAALRADMSRGQNAVNLVLDHPTLSGVDADQAHAGEVGKGGLSISSVTDLAQALDGIDLETTPIYIQASASALTFTALLAALVKQQGKSLAKVRGAVGMDPLSQLARDGHLSRDLDGIYGVMAQLTTWAAANAPQVQTITVQGHPYHNGGASTTQELAFALATAVEYIRAMQNRGLSIDDIAPRIRFSLSVGTNFFMEIARLRAARLLWAKIVKAFGGSEQAQKMSLHARTSAWNQTVYDPHVNLLRATTEAFSSAVGGCDSLHISPFDELLRTPDEFSRRIARNTHTVLREESHITRTVDPAGGSWYVENLTDSVGRKAWALFQEIEKQGGMVKALEAGWPQKQVADTATKRAANIAKRKDIFIGSNMYPNLKETRIEPEAVDFAARQAERAAALSQYRASANAGQKQAALDTLSQGGNKVEAAIQAALAGATLGEIAHAARADAKTGPTITPICAHRGAQAFEALREAAEAYVARVGQRPQVFLATMGPLTQHKGRADFATAFLAVGGIETIYPAGFTTPDEAADAALASGAKAVVICSTDPTYPELVPPLAQKLKHANPGLIVLLAGYPADHVEAFKAAGVDDFIHLNANCQSLLSTLQKKMGVA